MVSFKMSDLNKRENQKNEKYFPICITDGDDKVLIIQTIPESKIILNNKEISMEEFIEKIKSLE